MELFFNFCVAFLNQHLRILFNFMFSFLNVLKNGICELLFSICKLHFVDSQHRVDE